MDEGDPTNCEFCQIARGQGDALVVCESDDCIAFFPINPATLGHTLVISKHHFQDLWSVSDSVGHAMMDLAIRVGRALQVVVEPEGMNLIASSGEAASQTINHVHLHVVPRWHSDTIGTIWPPSRPMSETVKEGLAEAMRAECSRA